MKKLKLNRDELRWAAGFFDGEGSTYLHKTFYKRKDGNTTIGQHPYIQLAQAEPTVLERFDIAVNHLGTLSKPYAHTKQLRGNERPCYTYRISSFEKVQAVIALLWNFLSGPKREQAKYVLQNTTFKGSPPPKFCVVENCRRPHLARGYCRKHYRALPDVKQKDLAAFAAYRVQNKERISESQRQRRLDNLQFCRDRDLAAYYANREQINMRRREHRRKKQQEKMRST